jgi:hypothetical protein
MDDKRFMKRRRTGRRGGSRVYHQYDAAPSKLVRFSIALRLCRHTLLASVVVFFVKSVLLLVVIVELCLVPLTVSVIAELWTDV